MRYAALSVVSALLMSAAATAAEPEPKPLPEKPLLELGVMGGGGYFPDYPASDHSGLKGIVLPWFAYRGEIIRSDEKGLLRGRLIRSERFEFDVSLNGSFPTDDNGARRGMPDLDWMGEVGPRLQITLAQRPDRKAKVDFELPVRAVFSTDLSNLDYRGVVVQPELAYQAYNVFRTKAVLKLAVGSTFGSEELMDYFYEVAPQYATADRPAYDAEAGYLGSHLALTLALPLTDRISLFGLTRVANHSGATNEDSPLFREETNVSAGFGFTVSLYRSRRLGTR